MANRNLRMIAVTCLVLLFQTSSPSAQTPPTRGPVRAFRIPFRLSHGALIVVRGSIGSLHDLRFVLDTGTTQTIVDRRVADQLNLSCRPGNPVINFNRNLKMHQCVLPDILIGSFRVKKTLVHVASLTRLSSFLEDTDALIGMDLLGASRFTIDYATHKVTFDRLRRPAPPPASDPDDPVCMTAVIRVQGHPLRLIVDTGINGVFLYQRRLRSRVPHLRVLGASQDVNIGGRLPAKRVTLPGVRIAGTDTKLVVLLISAPPNNALSDIDGYLGVSALNARWITFDFTAGTLTWER